MLTVGGQQLFLRGKKLRVLSKLQADYNAKLPALYNEQYNLGYWAGFAAGECFDRPGADSATSPAPSEQDPAPSLATTEPTMEGAWTVPVPSGDGSSHGAEVASSEPVPVIQGELPPVSASVIIILEEFPLPPISCMVQSRGIDHRLGRSRDVSIAMYRSRIGRYTK